MRLKIIVSCLSFLAFLLFVTGEVSAGGCCYQSFEATNGVANGELATFNVGFVDPRAPIQTKFSNKPIDVHIVKQLPNQNCTLNEDITDENGYITGQCISNTPGTVQVYFSSPVLDDSENETFSYVQQNVVFKDHSLAVRQNPDEGNNSTMSGQVHEEQLARMQDKINELDETVERQQHQLNALQRLIQRLTLVFGRFFN
jgi:hypothetical protein